MIECKLYATSAARNFEFWQLKVITVTFVKSVNYMSF